MQCRGNRNCGGIRTAAAERRDAVVAVDALEACDNDNAVAVEQALDALRSDRTDAGRAIVQVGLDASLPAGQAGRMEAELIDCHCQQSHGNLFACTQQDVHFTCRRIICDFCGLFNEIIGGIALCGYDNDNLISGLCRLGYNVGNIENTFGIRNRRTAEFLHN